jgi:hypothetical protein
MEVVGGNNGGDHRLPAETGHILELGGHILTPLVLPWYAEDFEALVHRVDQEFETDALLGRAALVAAIAQERGRRNRPGDRVAETWRTWAGARPERQARSMYVPPSAPVSVPQTSWPFWSLALIVLGWTAIVVSIVLLIGAS